MQKTCVIYNEMYSYILQLQPKLWLGNKMDYGKLSKKKVPILGGNHDVFVYIFFIWVEFNFTHSLTDACSSFIFF